ncbi:hypothetical protein [Brevundimonas sp.]|uniref:hypothetical protein n=1 Tax=Brevundimonas sp. TaxID=1871086 RepID=UPI001A307A00|nr:hypothetical protein [Brevundimonas sp.]MBJ7484433.1 hypothetical protein [Brevundimonas sp.]
MAQIVFVHGVATRSSPALDLAEQSMADLLGRVVFQGVAHAILAPRWGDHVPKIPREIYATRQAAASFSLGIRDDEPAGIGVDEPSAAGSSLGALAADHPQFAVDAVLTRLADDAEAAHRRLTADELDLFAAAVDAQDDADKARALTGRAGSDAALAFAIQAEAESMSVLSAITDAVHGVTDRIRNAASTVAYGLLHDAVRPAVGLFGGDVFAYLNRGTLRGLIQQTVGDKLKAAWTAKSPDEPLIVIAHSMGGVIVTDMLADLTAAGLPATLTVDFLLTVGSQPGLFQAVGALSGGVPSAGSRQPRPPCVRAWCNVFDPIDPLAFAAGPMFDGVEDLEFNSLTGLVSAHTTYFKRPQFYARLRSRLADLSLLR